MNLKDVAMAATAGLMAISGVAVEKQDEFEKRVLEADGQPPELRPDADGRYSTNRLNFALNNGLAMTRGGRIWASWISGGDGPGSFTATSWSDDGGETWNGGLVLDWGNGSYPGLFQATDGLIYVSHDHGRSTNAEIWLHRFTEEDVLARRIVSKRGRLNMLVMRAMNSEYNRKK